MASSTDPGPSWSQRSETPVSNGSVGSSDIEIPGRRSVAAIREEIANKLEVKGPSGPPSGTARPTTPKSSVLLQRLLEDQKPSPLGKVVDKPPSGANFYQGVPPPSYCQPSYPAQTSPSKPLTVSIPSATRTLEDQMKEELKKAPLRDDSPELTPMHLPQKYNEPKSEPSSGYSTGGSHDESNHSSKDKEDEEVRTLHNTVILHGPVTVQRGSITPVHFEKANVYGKNDVNAMKTQLSRELEVADPRTFSPYSSGSSDHYGTVRRRPRPTIGTATLEPALTSHTFSDSGYEVNSYATDTMRTNDSKTTTEDSRSLLSTNGLSNSSYVPPPFTVGEVGPVLQSDFMLSRPDSLRSSVETPLVSPSEAGTRHGGASVASSSEPRPASSLSETSSSRIAPSHGNTEMSAWYRNMFKRLHKLDTPEPSSNALRYQVDAANTASTSGGIVNGRSRAEGSVTREERRAKSVGRTAENLFDEDVVDRWREQRRQLEISTGEIKINGDLSKNFNDLKRETKEELLYKKQAEKLSEELDNQKSRRHGYIPTASPSLQTNFDRFTGLMQSYGDTLPRRSPTPHRGGSVGPTGIQICTAIYDFAPLNNRELGLNKGDIVRIHRYIDANWIEGERNGRIGIFPTSYVQVESEFETSRDKLRAVYPFTARNRNEMSLKLGELVKFRREIDMNWIEGSNHLGEIGIFPRSYVRRVEEGTPEPGSSIPDRPKTPKLPNTPLDKVVNGFSNDLSTLSTTPISVNKASTSDHGGRVHEWQQKHDSAGYQGLAQAIPRGSQTYRVLYPYEPKNDDELELRVDDIVFVVEKCDDGWYIGTSLRTGLFGTFPGNFVERH